LCELRSLRRGDVNGWGFAENRAIDAAEGATSAVLGTLAAGAAGTAATAGLGTAAGALFAAGAGAAGTALLTTTAGTRTAGATIAGACAAISAPVAIPAVAGTAAAIGTGLIAGQGFKRVRRANRSCQCRRRKLAVASGPAQIAATTGAGGFRGHPVTDDHELHHKPRLDFVDFVEVGWSSNRSNVHTSTRTSVRLHSADWPGWLCPCLHVVHRRRLDCDVRCPPLAMRTRVRAPLAAVPPPWQVAVQPDAPQRQLGAGRQAAFGVLAHRGPVGTSLGRLDTAA
jgi:hypothetical protein